MSADPDAQQAQIRRLKQLLSGTAADELLKTGTALLVRKLAEPGPTDTPPHTEPAPEELVALRLRAMFESVFLIAAADGEIRRAEYDQLQALVRDLTDGGLPDDDVEKLLDRFAVELDRDDYDARIAHVARVLEDPDLRRSTFVMAAGMACIDGHLQDEEDDVMASLARAFGLSAAQASTIAERVRRELL